MASKLTELTSAQRALLLQSGVRSLPDSPSAKGFNAAEIKKRMEAPTAMLFDWLQRAIASANETFDKSVFYADHIPIGDETSSFKQGDFIIVFSDGEVAFYVYTGNTFSIIGEGMKTTKGRIDALLSALSSANANIDINKKAIASETARASSAERELSSQISAEHSAMVSETAKVASEAKDYADEKSASLQSAISKILDGASTVAKSLKDGSGNTITSTYETKSDAKAKVAVDNLRAILGLASASAQGLMSAEDKSRLDALYALLGATEDADDVVNTINEVLAVFAEYPEGVNLANALSLKVAFSDVINNLQSNEISKPLSAYQGKVLDGRLAEVEGRYVDKDDVFAAGMISVTGYDQSTGKITLRYNTSAVSINYTASTGVIKFTY